MAAELFKLVGTIVIDVTTANQTIDDTMEKVRQLSGTLQTTETQAENTGKSMGSGSKIGSAAVFMGNMFTKLAVKALEFGKAVTKTGFEFDASMEAYQGQFAALLNDSDKASKLVADLQMLAKISPLGMEGLANNAVSLLSTGTELADIIPTLEMLGNLSLGDTNKMNSIVRAYTQILSKGHLMAQEMYQLGDAGVPIREILTQYGGERYADGSWYQAKMDDPKEFIIDAEDMTAAFMAATAEGGKWHDYMFKMMDTWNGQVDRLGEGGKESLGAFFQPFFEVAKSDVLPQLSKSLENFGTWVTENQETLTMIAETMGKLATGGFNLLLTTVKGLTEALGALGEAWETLSGKMTDIAASINVFFNGNDITSVNTSKSGAVRGGGTGRSFGSDNEDGSHASGLDRVPFDGYRAILHRDEAVLNASEAAVWRAGGTAANTSRMESLMSNMIALMQQMVANTGVAQNIVLDSGVLVGQLAPQMDAHLGTISGRKGRGN